MDSNQGFEFGLVSRPIHDQLLLMPPQLIDVSHCLPSPIIRLRLLPLLLLPESLDSSDSLVESQATELDKMSQSLPAPTS